MEGIGSHIVLIGFMGSGKTTVGKLLADTLNIDFIDMDLYIEKQQKYSIKEIFAKKGESYFRKIESETLLEILDKSKRMVISTGGGTPCYLDNMNLIKSNSLSVYLKVGCRRLVERLKNDLQRPLIQNKTDKELFTYVKIALGERDKYYSQADIRLRAIDSPEKMTKRLTNYILKTDL